MDGSPKENFEEEKEENVHLQQLGYIVETIRNFNNLISGKVYDQHVGFKPGRRLNEDEPLRGYFCAKLHNIEAPSKEVQCKLIDTETIETKLEKKLQRGFEQKSDRFKSKIKDLEAKIDVLRKDIR